MMLSRSIWDFCATDWSCSEWGVPRLQHRVGPDLLQGLDCYGAIVQAIQQEQQVHLQLPSTSWQGTPQPSTATGLLTT